MLWAYITRLWTLALPEYHTTRLNVSIAAAQDPAHKSMDSIPHSALSIPSMIRDWPIMLIFYLLCYAAVLKILTYYAQYYAHVKELCLKSVCSIRVYLLV